MTDIDPSLFPDNETVAKGDLRGQLQAIKDRVELFPDAIAGTALTVNSAMFGDQKYIRRLFTAATAVTVTLQDDVPDGRMIELVRKGAGNVSAVAGGTSALSPIAGSGNWLTGLHTTTDYNEALIYATDPTFVTQLNTGQSWNTNSPSYTVSAGTNRLLVVGVTHEGATNIVPDSVTVTYGGQAMTRRIFEHHDFASADLEAVLFTLSESGIVAASGSTIVVSGHVTSSFTIHAVALQTVNQVTPVPETIGNEQPGGTAASANIVAADGAAVVALAATGDLADADWSASDLSELTDQDSAASMTGSMALGVFTPGQTALATCTWTSQPRAVLAVMEIAVAAGKSWRQISRPPIAI